MSIDRGMDKGDGLIYTVEYYSAIKKNEIKPLAATWMDLENVIQSGVRQKRRNIIWHPLYVKSKKEMMQMNLVTKQRETHRLRKQTYGCWEGKIGSLESVNIYTAIYSE